MKLGDTQLDDIDRRILAQLQEDCKAPLAHVGRRVGLSAPSVMERIRKLEEAGIIRGYHGVLDSRKVGLDVTAFIGVSMSSNGIEFLENVLVGIDEVLECHHVTGAYTVLLKVRTQNTQALERLISRVRQLDGVLRTETLVVLSTQLERTLIPLGVNVDDPPPSKKANGNGGLVSGVNNGTTHKDLKHEGASEALLGRGERSES
jgi:Lrp/AsnC family transcriptional regulator, leucine-responsive regulatory protein